jgi:hypothetical protein
MAVFVAALDKSHQRRAREIMRSAADFWLFRPGLFNARRRRRGLDLDYNFVVLRLKRLDGLRAPADKFPQACLERPAGQLEDSSNNSKDRPDYYPIADSLRKAIPPIQ